jgi:hypothetical protein
VSGAGPGRRPVRIVIRRIGITAASSLEARRLADALPRALEGAFARIGDGVTLGAPARALAAERVAAEVAAAVSARIAQGPPATVPGKP